MTRRRGTMNQEPNNTTHKARRSKHSLPNTDAEPSNGPIKRRAPYTQRACDACRKRKGRCNGCMPCAFCVRRSLECHFSVGQDSQPRSNGASDTQLNVHGVSHRAQGRTQAAADTTVGDQAPSVYLAPPLRTTEKFGPHGNAAAGHDTLSRVARSASKPLTASISSQSRTLRRYHGPTSPGYSLIAAKKQFRSQLRTRNQGDAGGSPRATSPDGSDSASESDEDLRIGLSARSQLATPLTHPSLFRPLGLFSQDECIRLLRVYQKVFGDLHPVCDVDGLVNQLPRLHAAALGDTSGRACNSNIVMGENDLLQLNLAIAIALTAEATSTSQLASMIYEHSRSILDTKLLRNAIDVNDVVTTLMLGVYFFFKDNTRLAWRMTGLAGRMAMELGLHSERVAQLLMNNGDDEQQWLSTISCTLLVLDRQWSAGTGLPANFKEADFAMAKPSLARTPYLKEMMHFTLISHKFNEPIARVARGEPIDEDDIEIMNFQVEQWKKRAIESRNFTHPIEWDDTPLPQPPWMTILYLRANAVRGILLRPFFLSETNDERAADKLKPGLELVTDSIRVLSILNSSTDVYREQLPNFQHFLVSSCALLFLIAIYTKKHHPPFSSEFAEAYPRMVRQDFESALELSAAYRELSIASRRLWKQLREVGEPLLRWCMSLETDCSDVALVTSATAATTATTATSPERRPDGNLTRMNDAEEECAVMSAQSVEIVQDVLPYESSAAPANVTTSTMLTDMGTEDPRLLDNSDSLDPLIFGWSLNPNGGFFSGGML